MSPGEPPIDDLVNFRLEFWSEPFVELLGPVWWATVAMFVLGVSYVYSRSIAMPTMLAILLGGSFITLLPATAQTVGLMLVTVGIASAIYQFYGRSDPRF